MLYQLEVKLNLIKVFFNPAGGWRVTVDVDPMERGKGNQQKPEKIERAEAAFEALSALDVKIGAHDQFGRVDVVADHHDHGQHLIEVEGDSSKQKEQALYSALGQVILSMSVIGPDLHYGLAVPANRAWRRQIAKIPVGAKERLGLYLYAVKEGAGTRWEPGEALTELGRG